MELKIEKILQYLEDDNITYHFVVVGAGGTGGYLVPNLARQVALANQKMTLNGNRTHTITLIDADDVEEKNLTRQNFISNDIGKNKAKVIATRYSKSFGVPISYIEEYIESTDQVVEYLKTITKPSFQNNGSLGDNGMRVVLIDCVDNTKTRHFLRNGLFNFHVCQSILISSGNEERAGQVIFSPNQSLDNHTYLMRGLARNNGNLITNSSSVVFPNPMEIFPESMRPKDKLPTEESCAEHAVSAPQNIHANMTAANIIFGFVNKLLNNEPISEMAVFFNTQNSSTKTYFAKKSDLISLLKIENPKNPFIPTFYSKDTYIKHVEEISNEDWNTMQNEARVLLEESHAATTVRHEDHIVVDQEIA